MAFFPCSLRQISRADRSNQLMLLRLFRLDPNKRRSYVLDEAMALWGRQQEA